MFPIFMSLLAISPVFPELPEITERGDVQKSDKSMSRFAFAEPHMGTEFRIVLYAPDAETAQSAARAAFERVAELNTILSDYDPDSELMRLCEAEVSRPIQVSPELFFILERSGSLYERTDGAFDPTVGPIVRLWRRARRMHKMPPSDRLAEALERVGFDQLALDPEARTVRLSRPGIRLDAGGIAKGYASDEAVRILREQSCPRCLVAGSGDIVAGDPPPGRDGWVIGIGPLADPNAPPSRFLSLANSAVSTSGDANQYVEFDGVRYSHIVDPATGLGLTERISATVVAPNGTTADSLATALCVLGVEKGLELIEQTSGCAALVIRAVEEGEQVDAATNLETLPFLNAPEEFDATLGGR